MVRLIKEEVKSKGGTPGFQAPEVITRGEWSMKADVYSLSMVILELVAERKCWMGNTYIF